WSSSKTRTRKVNDDVVEIPVPAIIDPQLFEQVQRQLRSRSPRVAPPRAIGRADALGVAAAGNRGDPSLDYLTINSPILDRQGWTSELNKMINDFGAPINPYETAIIIDYLANNYGARGATCARSATAKTSCQ